MLMLIKSIATHYFYFTEEPSTLTEAFCNFDFDLKLGYICKGSEKGVLNS